MLQFYRAGSAGRGQAPAVASPQYMLLFLKNYLLYMLLISLQNDLVRLTNTALAQLIPQKRSVNFTLRFRWAPVHFSSALPHRKGRPKSLIAFVSFLASGCCLQASVFLLYIWFRMCCCFCILAVRRAACCAFVAQLAILSCADRSVHSEHCKGVRLNV